MPLETLQHPVRQPARTVGAPPRLRPKGPVGPDFYRQFKTVASRPKQSAVERLEADKAKYVKSQVALSKPQPVGQTEVRTPPLNPGTAVRPTRKTTTQTKKKQEEVQLDLEHLSNLINGVNDGATANSEDSKALDGAAASHGSPRPPTPAGAQQKKERPCPPPRPDWSSPAKVRLKTSGPARVESPGSSGSPAAGAVRRVDVMPQASPVRTPCRPPQYIRQPLQPIPLHSKFPLRPATSHLRLFHTRTTLRPSPLKPVVAPSKPDNPPSSPAETLVPAPPPPSLPAFPPLSPAITRLSSSSSRKRPSLTRSKSDMSDRCSRAGTELERFFNLCGLDPADLQLTGSSSDIVSMARFRSVSAPGSECAGSGKEGEEEEDEDAAERVPYGVSVIERNARVIKWLYGLRQAKDNASGLDDSATLSKTKELFNQISVANEWDLITDGSGGIPLARKLCYAVGEVPYQITTAALYISLQIFLLDVVQMEASYVSMILFVSCAWDAVTDPLVGYLVSRSNWTPVGKLTPWLILSTPFGVLFYLLLWFVPQGPMSQGLSVLWFLTAACLFETLMSCYNVPYLSLGMFLGGDHRDRDSATAYRMSVKMAAMLLASVMQGQVIAVYNTEKQESCEHLGPAHETVPQSTSSPLTAPLQKTQKAFLTSALIMGALFFLCSLVLFLGVKEQRAPLCSDDKVRPPYLTSLKMLICHIPYQRLVLGFVFTSLAFQMSLGNFALFCSHAAGLGAQFQHLLLVLLASASVAVPLWQTVLLRIGKKATAYIGLSLFIPAVITVACVPSNLPVFMIMCVLMGFSVATMFLLPWSMLPDVVDDFAARHPSCRDLEPMFFSCYAFCSKLAGSLSVGISTMTLQFVGYRPGACNHGDGVVTALIVLFSPVPIALLLIGMVFFRSYPINERRCLQHQEQLTPIHPEATSSSSSSSDPRENAEQPSVLQPHRATSHDNMKTNMSHKSNSSPGCYNHDKICSVASCVHSDVSKSPAGEYSRPESVVQSNVNPQRHKQRLNSLQLSGEDTLGRNVPENDPGPSSSGSNVRSKMSWV